MYLAALAVTAFLAAALDRLVASAARAYQPRHARPHTGG
jgi:hypothetical protein